MKPRIKVNNLWKEYGDQVKIVFKHLPLPMHSKAPAAHAAAEAAHRQGRFWEMHDRLFANQKALDRVLVGGAHRRVQVEPQRRLQPKRRAAAIDRRHARRHKVRGHELGYTEERRVDAPLLQLLV